MQPVEFTRDDAELLFGPDADYKAAFEELDTDEDGEVKSSSVLATVYCSSYFNRCAYCQLEPRPLENNLVRLVSSAVEVRLRQPLPKLVIWNIYGPCMGMIWDEIWAIYGDDMVLIWVMLFHMKPIEAHCPHSFANLLS